MSAHHTRLIEPQAPLQQARRDRAFLLFLGLCLITNIPYLSLAETSRQFDLYIWLQTGLVLLPFVIGFLLPRRGEAMTQHEKGFWAALAFAFLLWWLSNAVNLLLTLDLIPTPSGVSTDLAFFFFYATWLAALGFAPHRATRKSDSGVRIGGLLATAGTIGLALCLFVYFIVIPSRLRPEIYDTWIPSYLFYTMLDFFITVLLLRLVQQADSTRWKTIYGILACSTIGFLVLDYIEALDYTQRYAWAGSDFVAIAWSLPFLGIALAARVRHFEFPGRVEGPVHQAGNGFDWQLVTSPIVLVTFFLLVMHVTLDQLGLVREGLRQAQGTVVAVGLLLFLVLAFIENRSLRRIAQVANAKTAEFEQLRIQREVEARSARAKSQFLANVSHEIRTPMNGILGMSEILLQGKMDGDQRRRAELVYSSAQGLMEIIDDILEYSRLEAGEITLASKPFVLEALARQMLDLARVAAEKKRIGMFLEIRNDVPALLVGDPSRLRQVLLNLLANAIKFTDEGEIRLCFGLAEATEREVRLRCEVVDTGIGIGPGIADRLFLPFSQGDASASRRHGGNGLGLAISREIIEAQSGSIGAIRNASGGATFWFEVPYRVTGVKPEH